MGNSNLQRAKTEKNDEFYTQLVDIENELRHYKKHFKGMVIMCNCDDPYESNFFKYFALNFNILGLKKLISTSYKGSQIAFNQFQFDGRDIDIMKDKPPYVIEIESVEDINGDGAIDLEDIELLLKKNPPRVLEGDGDFRSAECMELLKQADIVVSNPPFSLFREYVGQLVAYDKRFIILGNQNAITYKEVFPLIRNNKMWLGYKCGNMSFTVPKNYEPRETRYWQDETGQKWRSMGNICWYTNLDHSKRHEELIMYRTYNESDYPKYDNYDAINVDKVADIPVDYYGVMGVPITFLDKYNPKQFGIIGATESEGKGFSGGLWKEDSRVAHPMVNGKRIYKRVFICRK